MGTVPPSPMLQALSLYFPGHLDAAESADRLVRVLERIRTVLSPILGDRGVSLLLQRSVQQARAVHPWLVDPFADGEPADLSALEIAVAGQDPAAARAAAVDGVIHSFHALLTSLIGAPLTERLFESAWATSSLETSRKETLP